MATDRSDESLVRVAILVLGVVILFPLLMMAFVMPIGMMGWWGMSRFGGGVSPLWGLGMMLVWLLVLLGIGYLVYRAVTRGRIATRDRALEELRRAYARGELSDEEFDRRRERLERSE